MEERGSKEKTKDVEKKKKKKKKGGGEKSYKEVAWNYYYKYVFKFSL